MGYDAALVLAALPSSPTKSKRPTGPALERDCARASVHRGVRGASRRELDALWRASYCGKHVARLSPCCPRGD
jgi:hypothetical protein